MTEKKYTPPEVWEWDNQSGGKFTNINRPISGATHAVSYTHLTLPTILLV